MPTSLFQSFRYQFSGLRCFFKKENAKSSPSMIASAYSVAEKWRKEIHLSFAGAKSYIVPKSCVSVREPFSRARREAASRRAKGAGTVPPDRSKSSNSDE